MAPFLLYSGQTGRPIMKRYVSLPGENVAGWALRVI